MKYCFVLAIAAALTATVTAHAAEQTCVLAVEQMSCATCPYIVKKTLSDIPGVKDVEVSFADKTAIVIYDGAETDVATLTAATANVGFPSRQAE